MRKTFWWRRPVFGYRLVVRGFSALLLLSCACAPTTARLFPPPRVPVVSTLAQWPGVGAVVTDEVATLTYQNVRREGRTRLVAVLQHRQQIKILDEAGLKHARFALPSDGYSHVTQIVARSVSAQGDVVYMPQTAIETVVRNDLGAESPDLQMVRFVVPNATAGGVVDLYVERVYTAPDLVPPWTFGRELPTTRSEFAVVSGPDVKIDLQSGVGETLREVQPLQRDLGSGWVRLIFVEQNLPPYYTEPSMPHRSRQQPWVAAALRMARIGSDTIRMEDWRDVAARVQGLLDKVGGAALTGTPEERFRQVRDQIHAVDLDGLGVLPPLDAAKLLAGAPTVSRNAAALLTQALTDSGVRAYPALLASDGGAMPIVGFPSLSPFVRAVVAVDLREQVAGDVRCALTVESPPPYCALAAQGHLFVDAACKDCRFGELPIRYAGGQALVLSDPPAFVDVPVAQPHHHRLATTVRYKLDVEANLLGEASFEALGHEAQLLRRILRTAPDDVQRVHDLLTGDAATPAFDGLTVTGVGTPDEPITVRVAVKSAAEKLDYEIFRISAVDLVGRALSLEPWRSRRTPMRLEGPARRDVVVSIELPPGFEVEDKPVTKLLTPFLDYTAGFTKREQTLHYSRRLIIKTARVSVEDWSAFQAAVEAVHAADKDGVAVWVADEPPERKPMR